MELLAPDPARRAGRRRIVPPPPGAMGWTAEIRFLEEVGHDLALALWRMLRQARGWTPRPAGAKKPALLAPALREAACERIGQACAHAPQLVDSFGVFAAMMRAPADVTSEQVAAACRRIQAWAERDHLGIAVLFAEAAATVMPDAAEHACDAGRLCRRVALCQRAEQWYDRGFRLAVRASNRAVAVRALLGQGNLMKDLGRIREARASFESGRARAVEAKMRKAVADAHHSLLSLAAEAGLYRTAARHTRKALEYYAPQDPLIPYLVHDFVFVLVRNRYYEYTVGPLVQLLSVLREPREQLLVYGTLARAAGGMRNRPRYEEARAAVLRLIPSHPEFTAYPLNGLAEAAWCFGVTDDSRGFATRAIEAARSRSDPCDVAEGERLLAALSAGTEPPQADTPPEPFRVECLLQRLLSRLATWKVQTRNS